MQWNLQSKFIKWIERLDPVIRFKFYSFLILIEIIKNSKRNVEYQTWV